MATAPDALRLYVYMRVSQVPPTVEIEFPNEQLAMRYRSSIQVTKTLPQLRQRSKVVAITIPKSVIDIETTRSFQAFILHFDQPESAAQWQDALCRPVEDHPRQVFIRQYWDAAQLVDLERNLPLVASPGVKRSQPERAGPLPKSAKLSRTKT
ncbi:hypothetical protein BR93DRAFT_930708 [Coniochaeta sp. PMI_546]|nr:hypothetical protein BR93DRAFT_930708 [Coniochaeta sp. PMI_546]